MNNCNHDQNYQEQIIHDRTDYGVTREQEEELQALLENNLYEKFAAKIKLIHYADFAKFFAILSTDYRERVIESLVNDFPPQFLFELNSEIIISICKKYGLQNFAQIISKLDVVDIVWILENFEEDQAKDIIVFLPEGLKEQAEEALAYPADSAGRLIEKNIVTVPKYWNVGNVLDYIRSSKNLPEKFYEIFVVDVKFHPVGSLSVSILLQQQRHVALIDIVNTEIKKISAEMDQEDVAKLFNQYGLITAPVVNEEGRLVGGVNIDEIVDVIQEEAEEDIMSLGGIKESDVYASLISTSKKRMPWLIFNAISAFLSAAIVHMFEGTIEQLVLLAVVMPVVASMSGNAATQSMTVTVRTLALNDLNFSAAWRLISKELVVGFANGIFMALTAGLWVWFYFHNLSLALVFSVSIILVFTLGGLAASTVPVIFKNMKIDPAVASGVMVTCATDLLSYFIFLSLGALFLL